MAAGIDDISIYIPRLYVDAADFAEARGLDPAKLQKGLGVSKMAMVDTNQDPACLASNACLKIMKILVDSMFQLNHLLMNQRQ
jgi:hydroxymethylglutaryl-CoA synthase